MAITGASKEVSRLEGREKIRPLPGFGPDLGGGESSESGPTREALVEFLDEVAHEGINVLKIQEHRRLPATVDQLSASTRKELDDFVQRRLAQWRKLEEEKQL